jgi:membrane fusion protein
MQTEHPLFRTEAIQSRQTRWMGEIVLASPPSVRLLTMLCTVSVAGLLLFLVFGSYTKRSTVPGYLVPDLGLLKVYAPQAGVVLEKHVSEGGRVHQGDVLYVLSTDRMAIAGESTQAFISAQADQKRRSLRDEQEKTQLLQHEERASLQTKIASLQAEAASLEQQLNLQRDRVKLATENAARYRGLLEQDYISREQAQQKREEWLEQSSRLQEKTRERMAIVRELNLQKSELAGLGLRQQNQLAQIERTISGATQDLKESEAKRQIIITAPCNGIATTATVQAGQVADPAKPLLSIVPEGARLQAHLHASSRAIGFIRPGDTVLLRYQAYPYQKFGHAQGKVASVARTALAAQELGVPAGVLSADANEPLYLITVDLASQSIQAYGKSQALQPGMLVEADVMQEKRRLYEWALDPLYSAARNARQ